MKTDATRQGEHSYVIPERTRRAGFPTRRLHLRNPTSTATLCAFLGDFVPDPSSSPKSNIHPHSPIDEQGVKQPRPPMSHPSEDCGQECPRSNTSPFLDPHSEIRRTTHRLPHWQQGSVWVFVTWRLADSLPQAKLNQWRTEQEIWKELHAGVGEKQWGAEYRRRFSRHVDDWLDQGFGSCLLRDATMAKIVGDALRHFNGAWYELDSFVVMPNHVHVLFRPLGKHLLAAILKSWKGFTGRALNKRTGQRGAVWQDEYWDRLIRDDRHFSKAVEYIRANPIKANLREGQFLLESGLSSPLL